MSEGIWIAIISNLTTILVVLLGRRLSHNEHRKTEKKVDILMNGRGE